MEREGGRDREYTTYIRQNMLNTQTCECVVVRSHGLLCVLAVLVLSTHTYTYINIFDDLRCIWLYVAIGLGTLARSIAKYLAKADAIPPRLPATGSTGSYTVNSDLNKK